MECISHLLGFHKTCTVMTKHKCRRCRQLSRDVRAQVNVKDFIIEDLKNETVSRLPGSVNGQQLVIQNCEDCNIYVFDHSATITIDDCTNCRMFLGPIKTSVFFRDCKDIKAMVACQQFRTRDCSRLDIFLCCGSQPIIESTNNVKLGCFQCSYPQLDTQMKAAGRTVFNNTWSNIHDFTPAPGETNFSLLSEDVNIEDYIPLPTGEQFASLQITYDARKSCVPYTLGTRRKKSDESCLIIFFNDGGSHDRAISFIEAMRNNHPDCSLMQTKEVSMQSADAQRVFGTDSYSLAVQQGPVIGLEYNGTGVIKHCQETVVDLTKGTTGLVFVSQNLTAALQQIDNFYNFADMQMGM
ncbi:protein XRP2-like isoform X1 [Haliotis rufescens]|uniref:protein XRP2-like isoform X1 n=1 Tax=Haliotis rufescens TaxID=6454 RepID=UPI001EB002DA|nr:protein XRP2-like isoform X1 [Haliotis rufescens]